MLSSLELLLGARRISFSSNKQRIRYVGFLCNIIITYYSIYRCFPHVVNLAVQAVLDSMSKTIYQDNNDSHWLTSNDVIGILRKLINKV